MNLFDKTLAVCQSTKTPEQCVVAARFLAQAESHIDEQEYRTLSAHLSQRLDATMKDKLLDHIVKQGMKIIPRSVGGVYESFFIHRVMDFAYIGRITFENNKYHSHKLYKGAEAIGEIIVEWQEGRL